MCVCTFYNNNVGVGCRLEQAGSNGHPHLANMNDLTRLAVAADADVAGDNDNG